MPGLIQIIDRLMLMPIEYGLIFGPVPAFKNPDTW